MPESLLPTSWTLSHAAPEAVTAVLAGGDADWRPAAVPGNVQTSAFGLPLEALYARDRINEVAWMAGESWIYRTTFPRPATGPDEEAVYRFLGIDYACDLYLNGRHVGSHEGMFSPVEVPLDDAPAQTLTVVLHPYSADAKTLKACFSKGSGWDFAPPIIPRGLWDAAGICVRPRLRVTGAHVGTRLDNAQRADCTVHLSFSERVAAGSVTVTLAGVTRTVPLVDADGAAVPIHVPNPPLWWPNGLGGAALTELTAELQVAGRATEPFTHRVGLRSLARVACDGQAVADIPLQLVVNGRKVFLKGVNWVPLDACPGTATPERYAALLRQFAAGGVNCVRVWGGGVKEHDAFYALADELGLMVLQEFPLSFVKDSDDPAFLRLLAQEAAAIIDALRHHPSVVIWSGGNEHYALWERMDSGTPIMQAALPALAEMGVDYTDPRWPTGSRGYDEPALALLGSLATRLDGTRPYQVTSGMEGEGEAHGTWNWNPAIGDHRYRDAESLYAYWRGAHEHLYSECSVSGIANLAAIRHILGEADPALPATDDPLWRLHHAFYGAWDRLPDLWLDIPSTEALFGPAPDLETLVLTNQWMQGEGGRFLIEELRRKMGHTCGVIWWGVNEPWPTLAGNALIDWFARPRLGWPMVANAFAPTLLSLRYEHCVARRVHPELWLSHDGPAPFAGRYTVEVRRLPGAVQTFAGSITLEPYRSQLIRHLPPLRLRAGERAHVICRLFDGDAEVHRNDYLFASNEDAVPFDTAMVGLIRELWGAGV
jgi:beta-mannosidase